MNEDTPSPLNDVITMTLIHQYKEKRHLRTVPASNTR